MAEDVVEPTTYNALYLLAQKELRTPLQQWIAARRREGLSWRDIEADLYNKTRCRVSRVTLTKWLAHGPNAGPTD